MKLLLTGEPHIGKSTLLNHIISRIEDKQGFVTNEVVRDGRRTGFELVASNGFVATLASTDSASPIRVSRYGVEIASLEALIDALPPIGRPDTLLYIDEIGHMELYSAKFRQLVSQYLSQPNPFVGTLSSVYSDDFIRSLRIRSDIEIVQVTPENRELLVDAIVSRLH